MRTLAPPPQLAADHLFDLSIVFADMHIYAVPAGTRVTAVAEGGRLDGRRVEGDVLPGGGDWIVVGADGVARLDVRLTVRTDGGDLVHLAGQGRVRLGEAAQASFLAGDTVTPPDVVGRGTTQFEAAGEALAWLNAAVAVGTVTELSRRHIRYRYYELA
jgi:hypothetical protein